MVEVVSFRFRPHELARINKMSSTRQIDKTTAARELIEYGWLYYVIMQYKAGKLSLERTAKELNMSLSELVDLLAELNIQSPIKYEDYLEGLQNI